MLSFRHSEKGTCLGGSLGQHAPVDGREGEHEEERNEGKKERRRGATRKSRATFLFRGNKGRRKKGRKEERKDGRREGVGQTDRKIRHMDMAKHTPVRGRKAPSPSLHESRLSCLLRTRPSPLRSVCVGWAGACACRRHWSVGQGRAGQTMADRKREHGHTRPLLSF